MDHLKKDLQNDIEKLTSSTYRILSDMEGVSSIDIDILLDSTRRFYERTIELREVFNEKKKVLADEPIVMPFISGEVHEEEITMDDVVNEPPVIQEPEPVVEKEPEEELEIVQTIEQQIVEEPEPEVEITHEEVVIEENPIEEEPTIEETPSLDEEISAEVVVENEPIAEVKEEEEEDPIPFEVNRQSLQEEPEEEMAVKEETAVTEEKKIRPELFDYLNPSNGNSAAARQADLFASENTSSPTVGERFQQTHTRSILDHLSSTATTNNNEVNNRLNQTVVEDIRQIIGINEKFLFINELFGGNMREYNDFILTLNDIQSTDEAEDYLKSVRERKEWNSQSLAYVSFLKIFDRKFVK